MTSSVLLRIASMASRFLLLLLLTRYSPVAVVAQYGVLTGLVSSATFFLGFDLYIQTSRNIRRPTLFRHYLSNQIVFFAIGLLSLSVFLTFRPKTSIPIMTVVVILIADFLLQESTRLVLATGAYRSANVLQFLRQGAWPALSAIVVLVWHGTARDIGGVCTIWAVTDGLGLIAAGVLIRKAILPFVFAPSLRLFRAALPRQAMIFTSSLSLLLFSGLDRVILGSSSPPRFVAGYVFFSSLFGVVNTLIYSGLINPYFAALTDKMVPWAAKRALLRRFGLAVTVFATGMSLMLVLAADVFLSHIGRAEYKSVEYLRWYFAAFVIVSSCGLIPHFALYAKRDDRAIAIASAIATFVFLATWATLHLWHVRDAMPITIIVSAIALAATKLAAFTKRHGALGLLRLEAA